ncbi:hypothetical protein K2X33_00670, partial [bacterium]|nr:hypothetical protein [bacterium]
MGNHLGVGRRSLSIASILLGAALAAPPAKAVSLTFSDFDNTLIETRESAGGTFETPFVLFRIEQRANTLQSPPSGPAEVLLNPIEFHRNKAYFGKGNGEPGALNREMTLKDGSKITPGEYYLRNPDSYRYFFSTPGRNNVLEDLKAAEKRDPEGKWKAAFWPNMVEQLSNPESAKHFGLITARGHSKQDWEEFFQYLKEQGHIKYLPNFKLFHNVSLADYDQFSLRWNTARQKAGVLAEIVQHLGRLPNQESRLNPDGDATEPYHYVIFAD